MRLSYEDETELLKLISIINESDETKEVIIYSDEDGKIPSATYKDYVMSTFSVSAKKKELYVELKLEDITVAVSNLREQVDSLESQVNPAPVNFNAMTIDEVRTYQINVVNTECESIISEGIDVETNNGVEHFSLTSEDQSNITNLYYRALLFGVPASLYHSDTKLCRVFTAEEIIKIGSKATTYVTELITKCNHLHAWINRETDKDVIANIHMTSDLPEDLAKNIAEITATLEAKIEEANQTASGEDITETVEETTPAEETTETVEETTPAEETTETVEVVNTETITETVEENVVEETTPTEEASENVVEEVNVETITEATEATVEENVVETKTDEANEEATATENVESSEKTDEV
jgi:hypothetical protein